MTKFRRRISALLLCLCMPLMLLAAGPSESKPTNGVQDYDKSYPDGPFGTLRRINIQCPDIPDKASATGYLNRDLTPEQAGDLLRAGLDGLRGMPLAGEADPAANKSGWMTITRTDGSREVAALDLTYYNGKKVPYNWDGTELMKVIWTFPGLKDTKAAEKAVASYNAGHTPYGQKPPLVWPLKRLKAASGTESAYKGRADGVTKITFSTPYLWNENSNAPDSWHFSRDFTAAEADEFMRLYGKLQYTVTGPVNFLVGAGEDGHIAITYKDGQTVFVNATLQTQDSNFIRVTAGGDELMLFLMTWLPLQNTYYIDGEIHKYVQQQNGFGIPTLIVDPLDAPRE